MKNSPALTCDPDAKALSIHLTDSDVLETVELPKGVYLDLDADEKLLSSIPALPATAMLKDLLASRAA